MNSGDIFVFSDEGNLTTKYNRQKLGGSGRFDEKWLQNVIFQNIELVNVSDPVYEKIRLIPLCQELPLNDGIRNLYLDILAVTETGRLVLIECKLWKNPQARREVLAQALEYASLVQKLSYADLSAKLKGRIPSRSKDPITFLFEENNIDFDESRLIDQISENMRRGNFHLIIAGDGIRTDLMNLVNSSVMSGMTADLSLLEIAIHQNSSGEVLLLPTIPTQTETVTRTVLLSTDGMPAVIEEDFEKNSDNESFSGPGNSHKLAAKETNRLFWDKAMEEIEFDHPDQMPLKRGGTNWCKAVLPAPLKWVTAFRTKDKIGVFLRINSEDNEKYRLFFEDRLAQMKLEISPNITCDIPSDGGEWRDALFLSVTQRGIDTLDVSTEDQQLEWLSRHLNSFVNFLRPLINELPS